VGSATLDDHVSKYKILERLLLHFLNSYSSLNVTSTTYVVCLQGDQNVSVHLMISVQKYSILLL
jgi:hypothetical protein